MITPALLSSSSPENTNRTFEPSFLKKVNAVVDLHFSNPAFGLQELAAALLLSLSHPYRKVKALTGLLLATFCTPT